MAYGTRTVNVTPQSTLDNVLGNRDGATARVATEAFGAQLLGTGPIAERLEVLQAQITSGTVAQGTWAALKQIVPEIDGTGGEVLDSDTGDHQRATASGYNGTLEPNAGRYSWNNSWGRWVRIGATGLSQTATQAQLTAVKNELLEDIQSLTGGLAVEGAWNASGSFPAGAERGDFYVVSDAGTVDGQAFKVGDWLVAISDTPSTTTFAGSWIRAAYGAPSVTQYDSQADFVTADLSALPAGRVIKVESRDWIKVPGATAFAKADWEPVVFDTVADLKKSIRTLEVGSEIEAQGFTYNVEPGVFAKPHIVTAGGAFLTVKDEVFDILAFGADPTGVTECSAEWNLATQWGVSTGRKGRSHGDFYCLNTISPGGTLRWDFGSQTLLQWKGIDTADLTEVLHCPEGATETSGSGVFVLFDTSGMKDSTLDGQVVISGSLVGKMDLATRKNIRSNVAGISAATASSPEMVWAKLHVRGCGIGMYGADYSGSAPAVLGLTRWSISDLELSFNLSVIQTAESGNYTDEMDVRNVHLTRNGGRKTIIRGTEFSGNHALIKGLEDVKDIEPGTISTTAGSNIVNLSVDNPDLSEGMTVCIQGASSSLNAQPLWQAAEIVTKTGTQLLLDRNIENTVAAGNYVVDPMDIELFAGGWDYKRTYFENILGYGMLVRNKSWVLGRVKASRGVLGCQYDSPIIARPDVGHTCTIDITSEGTNQDNSDMKSLVAVQPLRDGNQTNGASVTIKAVGRRADYGVKSSLIRVIETFGAPVAPANIDANHNEHTEALTLLVTYDDISEYYQQIEGTNQAFAFGKMGSARVSNAKDITDGTAVSGFSGTGGGSSTKSPGSSGYIWFVVTENTRIRVSGNLPTGAAIAPDGRFYDTNTLVEVDRVLTRQTGRFTVHLDVPAGVNRFRFFANSGDDFEIDDLTVETVQVL